MLGFLGFTALHIEQHKLEIDDATYRSKFGAFFTNVETYLKPKARHYSTIFLSRRLLIALAIAFCGFSTVF